MNSTNGRLILLVEDDVDVRSTLTELLEFVGYRVRPAVNGAEALTSLRSSAERPHLILLDLMMPVMDGVAFCEALKEFPDLNAIPRIIMSAGGYRTGEMQCLEAKTFLKKPIDIDTLLQAIHQACSSLTS